MGTVFSDSRPCPIFQEASKGLTRPEKATRGPVMRRDNAAVALGGVMENLRRAWCRFMHREIMWPIWHHYECRECGTVWPIPFEQRARTASVHEVPSC